MKKILLFSAVMLLLSAVLAADRESEGKRPLKPIIDHLTILQANYTGTELNATSLESINSEIRSSEKMQKAFAKLKGTKLNFHLKYNKTSVIKMMVVFGERGFDKVVFDVDTLAGTNKNNILINIDLYNMETLVADVMGMFSKKPTVIELVKFYIRSNIIILKVLVLGDLSIKPFTAILRIVPIIFVIISMKELTGGLL